MAANKGILYAVGAYFLWGLLPLFWKALNTVPSAEILAHRVVWSLVFIILLLSLRRHWDWLKPAVHDRRTILTFIATGTLLSINWFTYIWGVNAGYIIETSLGYFINPLVNVLLGYLVLKEHLRPTQWLAITVAAAGVIYLTLSIGSLPWIALTLAFSFATYGLLRKTAKLNSGEGFFMETAFMFLPAIGFLFLQEARGSSSFIHGGLSITLLLIMAGVVTSIPLLLFAAGARRVTLTTLGLLQYIAPTMQFLIGVFIFHEAFGVQRLIGFSLIWGALLLYSIEGIIVHRRSPAAAPLTTTVP